MYRSFLRILHLYQITQDNALLKVGAKLKQEGLEDEQEWLEDHIVANLGRDFTIKRVAAAKAKEAPKSKKKKSAGEKRKVKKEKPTKSKKKRKKAPKEEEDSEAEGDEASIMESVDADASMDDDESVVSLSKVSVCRVFVLMVIGSHII